MRAGSVTDALTNAVQDACQRLPYVEHTYCDMTEEGTPNLRPVLEKPREDDLIVEVFSQTWGSTALGFGGIGGAAMTQAYTTLIVGPENTVLIYFAGVYAYTIPQEKYHLFKDHMLMRNMPGVYSAKAMMYGKD